MSTDPPDSDDDFFDLESVTDLDPELEEELARLAAKLPSPSPVRLTPELEELEGRIIDAEIRRNSHGDGIEPVMVGRFEAITTTRGGMGLVIKARDPQLERNVAIKLWMRSGPEAQAALLAEAKTLAKLKHPNVVTIYEPGLWNDRVYFVMEWIDGVDGHVWMNKPRSWREVRDVYVAAGTGLAAAHDAGIQHRDFKPPNILIDNDGRVVVADFGVADSLHAIPDHDAVGQIVGTPSYMAPERLRGERGDARSDQFSFCVAMWRALYRERPYPGDTGEELLVSIERGEIQECPAPFVPRWLSEVVRKGLSNDPDHRYRDMAELLDALRDDPPDAPADDDKGVDDELVEVVGRVLHKSMAGRARKLSPTTFLIALSLVFVLVLLGALAETALLNENTHLDAEPALPAHPCAGFDDSDPNADVHPNADLDPVVYEVCGLIRDDHSKAASLLWEHEYSYRLSAGGRSNIILGEDTLVIASTFIDHAEVLVSTDPDSAATAAENALAWVLQAADHLGHSDPRVQDIEFRVAGIKAKVVPDR